MGAPMFKYKDKLKAHKVRVFSSNYTLYGDMSGRVMGVLADSVPDIEIYSIDEAFLDLSSYTTHHDVVELAQQLPYQGQAVDGHTRICWYRKY